MKNKLQEIPERVSLLITNYLFLNHVAIQAVKLAFPKVQYLPLAFRLQ